MDPEEFKTEIEADIVRTLADKIAAHQIDVERARTIAQYVTTALKQHMTLEQIQATTDSFDDHFPELVPVVIEATKRYDEHVSQIVAAQATQLLKSGRVQSAAALMTEYTQKEERDDGSSRNP